MIEFKIQDNLLILIYYPLRTWVLEEFNKRDEIPLKKVFYFLKSDLLLPDQDEEEGLEFVLGRLVGDYFKIDSRILNTEKCVFLYKDMDVSVKFFIASQDISIFKKIIEITKEDIYIGGTNTHALHEKEFFQLIRDFPNSYEIKKYTEARLAVVLKNYFYSATYIEEKYNQYMNKRKSLKGRNLTEDFKESDLQKYKTILSKLEYMLINESLYNEKQWQKEIAQIILLLYPKYIHVFEEAPVLDGYAKKIRKIDFLLLDSNGNIDIIEIKKPFGNKIITEKTYRDNYIPMRELSGTVMQIEKYIFHLNRWGSRGESKLTSRYRHSLPRKFKIKITNPSGIIIMGRDKGLSVDQLADFEVVKRKYKNIIDIITYDDLLKRLNFIIESLK